MEKNEQVAYSNKLKALVKKEITVSFMMEHQAPKGGKIDVAVFKTGDVSLASKIKSYLWKHFSISVSKTNGHGNAETTLVVNMSELPLESFEKIDSEYLRVFPEGCQKKKKEIIPSPKDEGKEEEERIIDNIAKCRLMTSSFLNHVLHLDEEFCPVESRHDEFFDFVDDNGDKSNQIINCTDEAVALNVELALAWLIGDPSLVLRTGQELLVNFTKMLDGGKKLSKFGFCLPPSNKADDEEVYLRLRAVSTATPSVVDKGEGIFEAKYMRSSTVEKLQSLLSQMGWNTQADGNILRILASAKPVIEVKDTTSKEEIKPIQEQTPQNKHFVSPRELSTGGNISTATNEVKPSVFKILYKDKAEIIGKFKEIHQNDSLWSKVPGEKQKQVIDLLRNEVKSGPIDAYAKHLLDTRNKIPHLLWNENEAIEELKAVVCSPEFNKCKKETQDIAISFLKEKLTNDDPEGLISDLLDLF